MASKFASANASGYERHPSPVAPTFDPAAASKMTEPGAEFEPAVCSNSVLIKMIGLFTNSANSASPANSAAFYGLS